MTFSYTLRLDKDNQWIIASITDSNGKSFNDCVFKETVGLTSEQIRVGVENSIREQLATEAAAEAERVEIASRLAALNALVSGGPVSINVTV